MILFVLVLPSLLIGWFALKTGRKNVTIQSFMNFVFIVGHVGQSQPWAHCKVLPIDPDKWDLETV